MKRLIRVAMLLTALAFTTRCQEGMRAPFILTAGTAPTTYTFAIDAQTQVTLDESETSDSSDITVTSSEGNRYMNACVAHDGSEATGTPTFNGTSFMAIDSYTADMNFRFEWFKLANPTTGTHKVKVTCPGGSVSGMVMAVWTFTGVNQTTQNGPLANYTTWASDVSTVTVTSAGGDICLQVAINNACGVSGVGSGSTQDFYIHPNLDIGGAHKTAASASTQMDINWNTWCDEMNASSGIAIKGN